MLLDSGAEATVLDRRYAASTALGVEGELTAQGAGGASTAGLVKDLRIELGELALEGVTAATIDLSDVASKIGHPLPVILGAEIFDECVIDIDFVHRRIAFRDPHSFVPPSAALAVKTEAGRGIRTIDAVIEGRRAKLDFDLGNGTPLLLYPSFWEKEDFAAGRRLSSTLGGAVGGVNIDKLARIGRVIVAGVTFRDVPATLNGRQTEAARSEAVDGNIGLPLLSRSRLIVDFPHDRLLFVPPADTRTPFEIDRTGLSMQPIAAGWQVLYVAPATPAARAGVREGDIIARVDGRPMQPTGATRPSPTGATVRRVAEFASPWQTAAPFRSRWRITIELSRLSRDSLCAAEAQAIGGPDLCQASCGSGAAAPPGCQTRSDP